MIPRHLLPKAISPSPNKAAEIVCIQTTPLSRNTVAKTVNDSADNLSIQIKAKSSPVVSKVFPLPVTRVDIGSVILRTRDMDFNLVHMRKTSTEQDIFNRLFEFLKNTI